MSEFTHSIVLFTAEDGLPLEFNVRNTVEKAHLKALIEHGGGMCTQNDNAVHLISPGTKFLNADTGKMLVSTSYIHDCIKNNYLLDVNDYVYTISEAQTSDISDEDSQLAQRQSTCKSPKKKIPVMNMELSPIKRPNVSVETTPSDLAVPSSNSAAPPISNSSESFVECSQEASVSYRITSHVFCGNVMNPANEQIMSSEGLRENSEDFNPSQSLVSLSKQTQGLMNDNNKHLSSPVKQPNPLVVDNGSPMQLCSPLKGTELTRNDGKIPVNLYSPTKLVHPISPGITKNMPKKNIFSSPKKLVDLSPIKRADARKLDRNHINQALESPVRNRFPASPVKEHQENFDMDIDEPGNQLLSSPAKNPVRLLENTQKDVMSTSAVVSSSQPENDLDNFDNMLLSKALHKHPSEDEKSSSQTCTVSSSADAQILSRPSSAEEYYTPPPEVTNAENLPDSPNLSEINEEEYIRNLEAEVQAVLEKPLPRSIQDKITLVKYVCCVRKLTPRIVLESLMSKNNFLEL